METAKTDAKTAYDTARKEVTDADDEYKTENGKIDALQKVYDEKYAEKKETRDQYYVDNTKEQLYGNGKKGDQKVEGIVDKVRKA